MKKKIITQITIHNESYDTYKRLAEKINTDLTDILIIDDGSEKNIYKDIQTGKHLICIRHEKNLGYGSAFVTALTYASDRGYDILISLDSDSDEAAADIESLIENINYGYDIVTGSRILENYDHTSIPDNILDFANIISTEISSSTGYDITDPLSLTKSFNVASLKEMNFVESGLGVFIQLFIQASFSGLEVIEIPLSAKSTFKKELIQTETNENYLMLIETEKILYRSF